MWVFSLLDVKNVAKKTAWKLKDLYILQENEIEKIGMKLALQVHAPNKKQVVSFSTHMQF